MQTGIIYNEQSQEITQTTNFTAVSLIDKVRYVKGFGMFIKATVTTPSAGTFTAKADDNIMTKTAHGMLTGLKVQVSNAGGALPTGLSGATDYYVIRLGANTFSLASSLVDANAGTAIDITTDGTGTQTVTPTALAGGNYKLQASLNDSDWVDLDSAVNITATANFLVQKIDPMYKSVRLVITMTAGQLSVVPTTFAVGD